MARRNISIPDEIDRHLSSQLNASGYIVSLIKADIENKKPLTRDHIIRIVKEYIEEYGVPIKGDAVIEDFDISGWEG